MHPVDVIDFHARADEPVRHLLNGTRDGKLPYRLPITLGTMSSNRCNFSGFMLNDITDPLARPVMEVGVDEPELPHEVAIVPRCLKEVGPQYAGESSGREPRPTPRTMPLTAKSAKKSRCEDIRLVHTPLPEYATHKPGGATGIGDGSAPDSLAPCCWNFLPASQRAGLRRAVPKWGRSGRTPKRLAPRAAAPRSIVAPLSVDQEQTT